MTDSDLTLSLTKGIFAQKRVGKMKESALKFNRELLHHKQHRLIANTVEQQIQDIERNAYKETFDSLVNFVKEYYSARPVRVTEIPAAILVMGVNMPDHSNIFCLLEEQLHLNGIFVTVKLQSKECNSLSNLMQKLVSGIMYKYRQEIGSNSVTLKKMDYTLAKLLAYYENLPNLKLGQSPRKTPTKKNSHRTMPLKLKPMVVLLQDVEAFNPEILQELILSCNLYVTKLPIVLVFGMASAMTTLHNILPQKALSCLGIETFYSFTAIEYLTKIIQKVVLSPENPFKLGPKVFRLIVDTVLYHDFSVTNLTHMLKLCMLEHFYNNDVAYLCCSSAMISKHLHQLASGQIEKFKNLASLSRFLEKNPDCKARLKSKNDFMVFIADLLKKCHVHYRLLIIFLNCLHVLTKDLPGHPFEKHLREIYPLALEENITSLPCYEQAVKLLKMHSKDELVLKLQCCVELLSEVTCPDDEIVEVKESLCTHLQVLQKLTAADFEKEAVVCNNYDGNKITSRSQLQESLRMTLKTKRSKFEKCRENLVDYLTTVFEKLNPPSEQPLHEVLYFDNVLAVKHHLMTVPRITLHRDLVNPQLHLKCTCCKVDDQQEICPTMPDICTLYKLHLESGKLINMYDWLQAFKSVKEDAHSEEILDDDDSKLNIRFMHTVSELQFLGYVKPTKRKTDHVARLTFGSF